MCFKNLILSRSSVSTLRAPLNGGKCHKRKTELVNMSIMQMCRSTQCSKGWLELGLLWHPNKRTVSSERSDKTREKDIELLGQQIVGTQICGGTNGRQD